MNRLKVTISFVFFSGLFQSVLAQPQIKDSTDAYQYWAQRGIIEMVYEYMNDYVETVGEQKAKSEILGKDKYEQSFIVDINNKKLPDFAEISSFLNNNNWSGADKKLFLPLMKNFENSVKLDSNFFAAKKPGSEDLITVIPGHINKNINWKNKRQEIIINYTSELQKLAEHRLQTAIVKQPTVSEGKQSTNDSLSRNENGDKTNWLIWIKYLALFLLGVLMGGSLVIFISKQKIYSILDYEKDEYLHELRLSNEHFIFKYIGLFYILRKRKNDYKNGIERKNNVTIYNNLREQIDSLKKENFELKQKQANLTPNNKQSDSEDKKASIHEWEIKQSERINRKLFFSMPESNGHFIIDNGEPINDGRKYFKIEYLDASDRGELFYISSDRDKRAINRLESYLKPVCEIENILDADSATRIDFLSPGKVVLINDSWVIDAENKVKIKLI